MCGERESGRGGVIYVRALRDVRACVRPMLCMLCSQISKVAIRRRRPIENLQANRDRGRDRALCVRVERRENGTSRVENDDGR